MLALFLNPSFFALMFSGITIGIALILFAINYEKINLDTVLLIVLLLSIAIGIHGLLHFMYEVKYGFNPLKLT